MAIIPRIKIIGRFGKGAVDALWRKRGLKEWDLRYIEKYLPSHYHSLLFAKALPDPDLRYCSNSVAFDSLENAR